MQNYQKLEVWRKAVDLTVDIYSIVKSFPTDERFALVSQIKRAVTSIPINISEGCGRNTSKELAQFVHIAQGSASELECEILISTRLNYISETDSQALLIRIEELKRMLWGLESKLKTENF